MILSRRPYLELVFLCALLAALSGCADKAECGPEEDADGDGYCGSDDCDPDDRSIYPGAEDRYQDGVLQDCEEPDGTDEDGDGYAPGEDGETDCDDANAAVNPGATETCNGSDDDCDELVDDEDEGTEGYSTFYADEDGDGSGDALDVVSSCEQPDGYVSNAEDCDDGSAQRRPDLEETPYDGLDNDCDASTLDDDLDADGYALEEDCDDEDATTFPGAVEEDHCGDGVVNDCEGTTAEAMADCGLGGEVFLSEADAKLVGESAGAGSGYALAGACDFNGDGIPDLAVGAYRQTSAVSYEGAAYLVLGPLSGELGLASADSGLYGQQEGGNAGSSVAGVDVYADGYASLLVGAPNEDGSAVNSGNAYLVPGPVEDGTLALDEENAVRITGAEAYVGAGYSVAGLGDQDGDGVRELVIGAQGPTTEGAGVYLVSGAVSAGLDLADVDTRLVYASIDDGAAVAVASAREINGDGVEDLLVGLTYLGYADEGGAYLLLGPITGEVNLGDADALLAGASARDHVGGSVAAAGDVDGDGGEDLLVGAVGVDLGGSDAGAAYLVLGPVSGSGAIGDLAYAKLIGESADDAAGNSVSGPGDVDGDGFSDLAIGAVATDGFGAAYLVLGPPEARVDLSAADLKLTAEVEGDLAGASVAAAGDMNADGFADLAVGAIGAGEMPDEGASYLILGGGY